MQKLTTEKNTWIAHIYGHWKSSRCNEVTSLQNLEYCAKKEKVHTIYVSYIKGEKVVNKKVEAGSDMILSSISPQNVALEIKDLLQSLIEGHGQVELTLKAFLISQNIDETFGW